MKNPKTVKRRKIREPLVECICPTCGIIHKTYMYWSGRGKPRIYCLKHKYLIQVEFPLEICSIYL